MYPPPNTPTPNFGFTLHSTCGICASFTIPGAGAAGSWVRPHQPAQTGSPPTGKWCPNLPGSTGSSCSGPAGLQWAWGESPSCLLGQSLPYFSANKPPASPSHVEEWGYKQLSHQKPCHLLSRDGYPRTPTHPGSDAHTFGKVPWLCSHDLDGGSRHPQTSPSEDFGNNLTPHQSQDGRGRAGFPG